MNFSLNWFKEIFKSEKQKELEELKVREQYLKNEYAQAQVDKIKDDVVVVDKTKPYKKVKLVGDVLTIILHDGNFITKTGATPEDFLKVRTADTERQLFAIIPPPKELQEEKEAEVKRVEEKRLFDGINTLKASVDFNVSEDGSVYMNGINRSIPALLVKEFAKELESVGSNEQYQALKKFWLKCCLNPNAQSAEDLYGFLTNHNFKIDKHGNFYAYRRVRSASSDNRILVDFVSNSYNKVKAVWKKKPVNFEVFKDDSNNYVFGKRGADFDVHLGNLEELYKNLPSLKENRYTSAHTGKEDYRVGEVISMPRHEGNDDNSVSCSFGFHAASKKYDYSGFGDTPILMIINPMDVLAVPVGEIGKLRTCRWFFAMTLPESEKYILDDEDFDVTELGDIFEEKCLTNLQEHVQISFAEEVKRHTFTLPTITGGEVSKIVKTLEDMKNTISKRVVSIDEEEE